MKNVKWLNVIFGLCLCLATSSVFADRSTERPTDRPTDRRGGGTSPESVAPGSQSQAASPFAPPAPASPGTTANQAAPMTPANPAQVPTNTATGFSGSDSSRQKDIEKAFRFRGSNQVRERDAQGDDGAIDGRKGPTDLTHQECARSPEVSRYWREAWGAFTKCFWAEKVDALMRRLQSRIDASCSKPTSSGSQATFAPSTNSGQEKVYQECVAKLLIEARWQECAQDPTVKISLDAYRTALTECTKKKTSCRDSTQFNREREMTQKKIADRERELDLLKKRLQEIETRLSSCSQQ